MNYYRKIFTIIFLIFAIIPIAHAQTAEQLRKTIEERNSTILQLEQEIAKYQTDIDALGKEKDSLSNAIKSLDISKKKLEANTKVIENKIYTKNLEIKELSLQIGDKGERISDGKTVISRSLYNIYQNNSASILESILNKKSFSEVWRSEDELANLQAGMQDKIKDLQSLKANLEVNKKATELKKKELVLLTDDLKSQTKILAETVKEKNAILKETKSTEANYNRLLADRMAQKEAFEKEIANLESSLKLVIDPNSIPTTGSKVLDWPLDTVRLTQSFGNTEFSRTNSRVYNGNGHNGIDFGASIGTPIKASAAGVVTNVINPLKNQRCGYGKWIVVKHNNGLSTLYAHLSLTNTTVGSNVSAGQIIGYSGNTGFTTGPHLHFGLYVTQGLQTIASKSCPGIIIPYAAFNAYLNPLQYLPS